MKRSMKVPLVMSAFAALIGLIVWLSGDPPRRPRPPGFDDQWKGLALIHEGEWSLDPIERGVVQGEFFLASDELAVCVQEHGGEGVTVKLELLVETEQGQTHFEYVSVQGDQNKEGAPFIPSGVEGPSQPWMACVTRVLEGTPPLPTPGLAESTRWRLEVNFAVPRLSDLPKAPWWRRFIPKRWRSGSAGGNHIG